MAGEVVADIIRKQLYGKEVKDLTEEEKQTISALSQLASGLAVAAGGGNIGDASAAISSSKNAVENNGLSWADGGNGGNFIGIPYETGANLDNNLDAYAQGYLTEEEIIQLMDDMNSGRFMYDPLREDFKRFPEDVAILVTPYGDYIAFRDADSWGDYAIATAGVLPFVKYIKVAGKVVKVETKAAQTLVKDAEAAYKAGNVAEGNRLMNQVASQSTQVETTVIRQAHSSNAGKGTTGQIVKNSDGLHEVKISATPLEGQNRLNTPDLGGNKKFKPAEAAAAAQLEPVLGKMERYSLPSVGNQRESPDFIIISGPNKGKTIDVMYTTDRLSQKEIDGLNKFYEKNMNQGRGKDVIQDHLKKADFVPVDFRVLTPANQKIFIDYIKTLPISQQNKIIIMR